MVNIYYRYLTQIEDFYILCNTWCESHYSGNENLEEIENQMSIDFSNKQPGDWFIMLWNMLLFTLNEESTDKDYGTIRNILLFMLRNADILCMSYGDVCENQRLVSSALQETQDIAKLHYPLYEMLHCANHQQHRFKLHKPTDSEKQKDPVNQAKRGLSNTLISTLSDANFTKGLWGYYQSFHGRTCQHLNYENWYSYYLNFINLALNSPISTLLFPVLLTAYLVDPVISQSSYEWNNQVISTFMKPKDRRFTKEEQKQAFQLFWWIEAELSNFRKAPLSFFVKSFQTDIKQAKSNGNDLILDALNDVFNEIGASPFQVFFQFPIFNYETIADIVCNIIKIDNKMEILRFFKMNSTRIDISDKVGSIPNVLPVHQKLLMAISRLTTFQCYYNYSTKSPFSDPERKALETLQSSPCYVDYSQNYYSENNPMDCHSVYSVFCDIFSIKSTRHMNHLAFCEFFAIDLRKRNVFELLQDLYDIDFLKQCEAMRTSAIQEFERSLNYELQSSQARIKEITLLHLIIKHFKEDDCSVFLRSAFNFEPHFFCRYLDNYCARKKISITQQMLNDSFLSKAFPVILDLSIIYLQEKLNHYWQFEFSRSHVSKKGLRRNRVIKVDRRETLNSKQEEQAQDNVN